MDRGQEWADEHEGVVMANTYDANGTILYALQLRSIGIERDLTGGGVMRRLELPSAEQLLAVYNLPLILGETDTAQARTASVNEHPPALPTEGTPERAALEARYPIEPWMDTGTYVTFLGKMVVQDKTAPALFCEACRPGALAGYEDVCRMAFLNIYDAAGQFVHGVTHLHPSHTSLIAYAQQDQPEREATYSRLCACPCGSGHPARHMVQGPFTLRYDAEQKFYNSDADGGETTAWAAGTTFVLGAGVGGSAVTDAHIVLTAETTT